MFRFVLKNSFFKGVAFCCAMFAATQAEGAFITPSSTTSVSPWTRPVDLTAATSTKTTHQSWDVFANITNQSPDVANLNPSGTADLDTTVPVSGAFIFGPGIYTGFGGGGSPGRWEVALPSLGDSTPGLFTTFLLQIRTIGAIGGQQIDNTATILTPSSSPVLLSSLLNYSRQELSRTLGSIPPAPGDLDVVDTKFEFILPGNVSSYTLSFGSTITHTLLDAVTIDTSVSPIPEPSTYGLMTLVGLVASAFYYRRQKQVHLRSNTHNIGEDYLLASAK